MLLPSLISLRRPTDAVLTPEDIFGSSLGGIFTDDLQNQHGDSDPGTTVVYKSSRYGELEFRTADVNGEEQRRKFAHYLWNAGILMAELVGGRPRAQAHQDRHGADAMIGGEDGGQASGEWWISEEEERMWSVRDETVLELGAGVGLAGIVGASSGAKDVTISDYPAAVILDTITKNVSENVPRDLRARVTVQAHRWGELDTPFAEASAHGFTRILAADCFWMPYEHENLARSMLHFLSPSPHSVIYCIAGFHTGRAKLAPFFEEVVPAVGLTIIEVYEMNAEGKRRPWARERDGGAEDFGERKKWLVVARLQRAIG